MFGFIYLNRDTYFSLPAGGADVGGISWSLSDPYTNKTFTGMQLRSDNDYWLPRSESDLRLQISD